MFVRGYGIIISSLTRLWNINEECIPSNKKFEDKSLDDDDYNDGGDYGDNDGDNDDNNTAHVNIDEHNGDDRGRLRKWISVIVFELHNNNGEFFVRCVDSFRKNIEFSW